jgi:hypothetical protein
MREPKLVEQRVWGRFVRLYGPTACQVPRERRHDTLPQAVQRVLACRGLLLRVEWWR